MRREVLLFDGIGPTNTDNVVEIVKDRAREGDIGHVVVASISGKTALRFAQEFKGMNMSIVCVSGPPSWSMFEEYDYPMVKGEIRERLEELDVTIVDRTPSTLGDTIEYGLARYGYLPASLAVAETLLAIGGYGMKTAVEAILMATDCGTMPASVPVISIAGSGSGADTAIVAKSAFSPCFFSRDSSKRFQVFEIIAMPREKKWYKEIRYADFSFYETKTEP